MFAFKWGGSHHRPVPLLAGTGRCRKLLEAARAGAVSAPVDLRFLSRPHSNPVNAENVRADVVSYLKTLYDSVAEVLPDVRDSTLDDEPVAESEQSAGISLWTDSYSVELNKHASGSNLPQGSKVEGNDKHKARKMRRGVKMNPERVPETEVGGLEVRKLPPGAMKEYWETYKMNSGLASPASFPTFRRAAFVAIQSAQVRCYGLKMSEASFPGVESGFLKLKSRQPLSLLLAKLF